MIILSMASEELLSMTCTVHMRITAAGYVAEKDAHTLERFDGPGCSCGSDASLESTEGWQKHVDVEEDQCCLDDAQSYL